MTGRRKKFSGASMSLPEAYGHSMGKLVLFVGRHFVTTLMTAISFAVIYKFVLAKDSPKTKE